MVQDLESMPLFLSEVSRSESQQWPGPEAGHTSPEPGSSSPQHHTMKAG